MRARREAAAAYVADDVALIHSRAGASAAEPREMPIQSRDVAAVLQDDRVAVAALGAAEQHLAVAGGADRCSGRSGIVDAAMRAHRVEDWVTPARIEV